MRIEFVVTLASWALSTKITSMGMLLTRLATAILILAVSVKVLSSIDAENLRNSMIAVTILLGEMVGAMAILMTINVVDGANQIYKGFVRIASALFVVSLALKVVSGI